MSEKAKHLISLGLPVGQHNINIVSDINEGLHGNSNSYLSRW